MDRTTKVTLFLAVFVSLALGVVIGARAEVLKHVFSLTPGTHCLTHQLDGQKLTVSVTEGDCDDGDVIEVAEPAAPGEISQCPLDDYNVIIGDEQAGKIKGTNGNDAIFAGSGVVVSGRAGNDCIIVGSGSKVDGNSGDDYIVAGSGSKVDGGPGEDVCQDNGGSSVKCEIIN